MRTCGSGATATLIVMSVREDCRHYSTRTTPAGEQVQRCRLGANETMPFGCPEHCLFFEPRAISDAGWERRGDEDTDPGPPEH